jgi:hypothetical protein
MPAILIGNLNKTTNDIIFRLILKPERFITACHSICGMVYNSKSFVESGISMHWQGIEEKAKLYERNGESVDVIGVNRSRVKVSGIKLDSNISEILTSF